MSDEDQHDATYDGQLHLENSEVEEVEDQSIKLEDKIVAADDSPKNSEKQEHALSSNDEGLDISESDKSTQPGTGKPFFIDTSNAEDTKCSVIEKGTSEEELELKQSVSEETAGEKEVDDVKVGESSLVEESKDGTLGFDMDGEEEKNDSLTDALDEGRDDEAYTDAIDVDPDTSASAVHEEVLGSGSDSEEEKEKQIEDDDVGNEAVREDETKHPDEDVVPSEVDSVLNYEALKQNEDQLKQNIDSYAENLSPPELPPRSDSSAEAPRLPVRPSPSKMPSRHVISNPIRDIKPGQVHAVPPPLSEEMQSPNFRTHMKKHRRSSSADFDLILNRFVQNENEFTTMDHKNKEIAKQGIVHLREEYDAVQDSSSQELIQYDWPFWSKVVHNFEEIVKNDSAKLEIEVGKGIPSQIRGLIWQLVTNSSSETIKELYISLASLTSPNEAAIRKDLSRTKHITEEKKQSLFNVLKAYSLYDPDVGYTQGMGFIVTTFVLNCEEEWQSFSLFIKLMNVYGFRELFLPGMPGLMLKLYQFDALLEEHDPQLYNHLIRQGIRSSMYATQWFLTIFSYKFPLDFVLRIMDIIIIEGIESILKFSVTLLLNNSRNLIVLNFDPLLDFLKDGLFQYYALSDNPERYNIDKFIADSLKIKLTPLQLERYVKEYDEIHKLETEREQKYEELRIKNKQLHNDLRKLEKDYALLNKEHITIANELIKNRLRLETLQDENNDLQQTLDDLKKQLQYEMYKQTLPNPDSEIPTDFKEDLAKTMERNLEVMNENQELRDRIEELERENYQLRTGESLPTKASLKSSRLGAWSFKNRWK